MYVTHNYLGLMWNKKMKSNAASSTITIVYLLKYLVVICVLFIRLSYTSYKNRVEIRYIAAVAKRPNPQNTLQKSEGERQETRTHHTTHTAAAEQQRTDAGQGTQQKRTRTLPLLLP